MHALLSALLTFVVLVVAQLVVWRVRRPGHYTALSVLSLCAVAFSEAIFWLAGDSPIVGAVAPRTTLETWTFLMLYAAITVAYMITYSAVQADSPTMSILLAIEAAGPGGSMLERLLASLHDDVLVVPRLEDLVIGRLATVESGRYVITPTGARLARIYIFYRALLGMEKGG